MVEMSDIPQIVLDNIINFVNHYYNGVTSSKMIEMIKKNINEAYPHFPKEAKDKLYSVYLLAYFKKLETLTNDERAKIGAKSFFDKVVVPASAAASPSRGFHAASPEATVTRYGRAVKPSGAAAPSPAPARRMTERQQFLTMDPYAAPILHQVERETPEEYSAAVLMKMKEANTNSNNSRGGRRRTRRRHMRRTKSHK